MNRVGIRKVIFSETFILPKDETLFLTIPLDFKDLSVEIRVLEQDRDDGIPASWTTADGILKLDFFGFTQGTTRIIQKPEKIGVVGTEVLAFSASIYKHFDAYLVHIQFMVGGAVNA